MKTFRNWMALMGFNGKQVTLAATSLGVGPGRAQALSAGTKPATRTERLAMSALAAGLDEWHPDNHDDMVRIGQILAIMRGVSKQEEADAIL